jgi:hypothetical protein
MSATIYINKDGIYSLRKISFAMMGYLGLNYFKNKNHDLPIAKFRNIDLNELIDDVIIRLCIEFETGYQFDKMLKIKEILSQVVFIGLKATLLVAIYYDGHIDQFVWMLYKYPIHCLAIINEDIETYDTLTKEITKNIRSSYRVLILFIDNYLLPLELIRVLKDYII